MAIEHSIWTLLLLFPHWDDITSFLLLYFKWYRIFSSILQSNVSIFSLGNWKKEIKHSIPWNFKRNDITHEASITMEKLIEKFCKLAVLKLFCLIEYLKALHCLCFIWTKTEVVFTTKVNWVNICGQNFQIANSQSEALLSVSSALYFHRITSGTASTQGLNIDHKKEFLEK